MSDPTYDEPQVTMWWATERCPVCRSRLFTDGRFLYCENDDVCGWRERAFLVMDADDAPVTDNGG